MLLKKVWIKWFCIIFQHCSKLSNFPLKLHFKKCQGTLWRQPLAFTPSHVCRNIFISSLALTLLIICVHIHKYCVCVCVVMRSCASLPTTCTAMCTNSECKCHSSATASHFISFYFALHTSCHSRFCSKRCNASCFCLYSTSFVFVFVVSF